MKAMMGAAALLLTAAPVAAQNAADVARIGPILAAEKAAMDKLVNYDGVYAGKWQMFRPDGSVAEHGSTVHRVGPFLGGSIKMMEGRNYTPEGALVFNGTMVLTYNATTKAWKMNVFAFGDAFEVKPVFTDTGYYFDAPSTGPGFRRVNITVAPTYWGEEVYDHADGKPPFRVFSMKLDRIGPTDWPLGRPNTVPEAPR